jgi:hypothetical protein
LTEEEEGERDGVIFSLVRNWEIVKESKLVVLVAVHNSISILHRLSFVSCKRWIKRRKS